VITEMSRRWRRWAAHNRVRVTMFFALVYVAFSFPDPVRLLPGALLVALGQSTRLWAAGHLQRNVELARGGPYRWVRHPLYLGSFLMGVGLALVAVHAPAWLTAFLILYVAFFWPAMHVEELRLQSLFGAEYQEFMVEVPRLLPRLWPIRRGPQPPPAGSFSWERALANRELRSAAAMAALLILQGLKLVLAAWTGGPPPG